MNIRGPGGWKKVDANFMFLRSIPEPNSGCWLWCGEMDRAGYGRVSMASKKISAHILSYKLSGGIIPDGLELDHTCKVRCCINPDHLEPVTRIVNMKRSSVWDWNKKKTHCPAGHPYQGPNLYISKTGQRYCLTCIENRRLAGKTRNKRGISR